MLFYVGHGYRVIARDCRSHGRRTPSAAGDEMDAYAAAA